MRAASSSRLPCRKTSTRSGAPLAQQVAVAALQRRARQHHAFAGGAGLGQPRAQREQPALAVGIGQRLPAAMRATFSGGWKSSPSR